MKRLLSAQFGIALLLTVTLGAAQSASPAADAAMRGDKAAVAKFIKDGVDIGAAQGDGMTALHWAAERGDAEMAEMLVFAGANVSAVTRIGLYTPLHLAAKAGSAPVVRVLIKGGADVNVKANPSGATPIHLAALTGSADVINLLADAKADVNAKEAEWGQTPLVFAASANRASAITALLKRGADPNIQTKTVDVQKQGQLDRAAVERQRKMIEAFIGKDTNQRPTPAQMQAAIQASREVLISGKIPPPDPNAPPPRGFNPEEINRRVSDVLADVIFCCTMTDVATLEREGYEADRIAFSGDLMKDALLETIEKYDIKVSRGDYLVMTLHRQENLTDGTRLRAILQGLVQSGRRVR